MQTEMALIPLEIKSTRHRFSMHPELLLRKLAYARVIGSKALQMHSTGHLVTCVFTNDINKAFHLVEKSRILNSCEPFYDNESMRKRKKQR